MRGPRTRLVGCLLLGALCAPAASAHGPTVKVAYGGVKPTALTIRVGDTVHFHNHNASGSPCTVAARDGSFESPTLGRGEGWHHTFETPGRFPFVVREFPSAAGAIVVVPADGDAGTE